MTPVSKKLKRLVKDNGLLKAHVWALRSRQPLVNLFSVRRNLLFASVFSRTLVSYDRLLNTYALARDIEARGIEGSFVECGVWRGGIAGLLAHIAEQGGQGRHVHLFDSFEGCPKPTQEDGRMGVKFGLRNHADPLQAIGLYAASVEDVSAFLFDELKLSRERVSLHKGWFQDTLPYARRTIGKVALLRIDADWYESVKMCLTHLYQNVVEGGYVILDDYGKYPGCKYALREFCQHNNLHIDLRFADNSGAWFAKPPSTSQRVAV